MENNTKSNIIQFPTREVAPANNIEATYVAGSEETYGQFIITRSMSTKFDQHSLLLGLCYGTKLRYYPYTLLGSHHTQSFPSAIS